ncbi:MAG: wapA1 [Haloplasmataceae bacterium]|jgi:hypothetical protein|nr:wapA1 [Haloplasmataceae bacterium]
MFRKRKKIILKEDSPSSYKLFMKYSKYICLVLAFAMVFTSINWNVFITKANDDVINEDATENYLDQSTDPYSIPISFEDLSKRNAYTKYFRKLDGSYEVSVYDEAVHYLNENEWKQIDNSLLLDSITEEYENKDNSFKFKLPKNIHENKSFKLNYDDYKIEWTIDNIDHTELTISDNEKSNSNNLRLVENINQQAIYKNIQPNVDLEYIIKSHEIKENIILNSYIENYNVKYQFKVKDLVLKEHDGEFVFVNELGEVIFSLGSFIMYDSNFNETRDINVQINNSNENEYDLIITPSDGWLKSSERAFPVILDPTITISSSGASPLRDKYTYGSYADDTSYLKTGQTSSYTYRSYIELNLSEVVSKPVITYANLQLDVYNSNNYCDNDCQVNVREVLPSVTFSNITGSSTNITVPEVVDYVMVNKNNTTGGDC